MRRELASKASQRGKQRGRLHLLLPMGVLVLLLVGCVRGGGEKTAPPEAGQAGERAPAQAGGQALTPQYIPPAEPPQYIPPEKAPVYVQPGREPVYIPRPEGKPDDQPPERKGLKEE